MRFMMFMYPQIEDADWSPSAEAVAEMGRYNLELRDAGMLLSLDGLQPPSEGASVVFEGRGEVRVLDGPFAEAKEVVGGYWLIQARSIEEAIEWVKRCPGEHCRIEVRRIPELEDFPPDIREAIPYDPSLHLGVEDASAPEAGAS
ncbi:MAG: YciI family protein [Actinobacteria bacterium]|nr:YciI family protein [Actinomycetota bacterium]MBS1883316.1 YciI family protein [Actinomycetota bacterium]